MKAAERVIPLARPAIDEREEELVLDVLRSGHLSLGPAIPRFESAMSRSLLSSARSVPSSVRSSSPLRARRTTTRLPVSVSKSNACSGLPSASMT